MHNVRQIVPHLNNITKVVNISRNKAQKVFFINKTLDFIYWGMFSGFNNGGTAVRNLGDKKLLVTVTRRVWFLDVYDLSASELAKIAS